MKICFTKRGPETLRNASLSNRVYVAGFAPRRGTIHRIITALIKVSVGLWFLFPQASQAASFQPLVDATTGAYMSFASDVSPDGQFVSGFGPASGIQAMRWRSPGTIDIIGDLPGGSDNGFGSGISNDGSSMSGHGSGVCEEGWLWTESAGFLGMGDLPGGACFSHANSISGDGSVVIGRSDSASGIEAYRWTALDGMVGLGDLPGGHFFSYAEAISEDGSTIVGGSISGSGMEAFRWTASEGMVGLGDLPGGSFDSFAGGVSSDGSLIVGQSDSHSLPPFPPVEPPGFSSPPNNPGWEAFLWTQASNQMQGLGDLPGGDSFSIAFDVSDNAIVVGFGTTDTGEEAFIWDSVNGMRNLKSVLETQGLASALSGWTLQVATAISKDGRYVVGFGIDPNGLTQAWIAQLSSGECGNGIVEPSQGEQCDEGAANGTGDSCCSSTCQFVSSGTTCRAAAGVCDIAESCTGASASCPTDAKSTAVCRSAAGPCDATESCDGVSNACPANDFQPNGTVCTDGNACTQTDTCQNGSCTGSNPVGCTALDQCHVAGTCDPSSGMCSNPVALDQQSPTIGSVTANPNTLWPPNHKMVPVTVAVSASDNCDTTPVCKITAVSSNEPVNGTGDGDTAPDWQITGNLKVNLRAERAGGGNGRAYTITVQCTDVSHNSATKTVAVTVVHDQGKK